MDEHEPWPVIIIRLIIKDAIAILRWQKALLFSTGIRGRFLSFPTRNKRVSLFFFFLIFRKKKKGKKTRAEVMVDESSFPPTSRPVINTEKGLTKE